MIRKKSGKNFKKSGKNQGIFWYKKVATLICDYNYLWSSEFRPEIDWIYIVKFWTRTTIGVQILPILCSLGGNLAKLYVGAPRHRLWEFMDPLLNRISPPYFCIELDEEIYGGPSEFTFVGGPCLINFRAKCERETSLESYKQNVQGNFIRSITDSSFWILTGIGVYQILF